MMNQFLTILLLFFAQSTYAQHEDVFVGETGNILLQHLENDYKPTTVLDYGNARRKMFGIVDNVNDSIYCVYTNYRIYIDPNKDPKSDAFAKGINTEHSFPQSKGAKDMAKSDVHHLFPTRVDVNSERGHVPFDDIPDSQTDAWFYLSSQSSNIPNSNIDLYSESDKGIRFEPPEAHKGNLARAMMYFYTMYHEKADNADNGYFQGMIPTLCQWHFEDEVDQREWDRTWAIADFQSNKPNPFVLDCTLAERSYCSNTGLSCQPDGLANNPTLIQSYGVYPNPASLATKIRFTLGTAFPKGQLTIFELTGKQVRTKNLTQLVTGPNEIELDLSDWNSGFYTYSIQVGGALVSGKLIVY